MASLRKRYVDRIEASPRQDAPPVTSSPTTAAKLPEPAADAGKPPEQPATTESPADVAAKNALRDRLREMENAESLTRQTQQQPPPQAAEPQQPEQPSLEDQIAHLPPRVQGWYRNHPELAMDPERAAQVQYCHHVARRETGEELTPAYYDRMEQMLGLRQPNGHDVAVPKQNIEPAPPRRAEPVRQQQRSAVAYSAPPTREVPSMTTGRPASRRAPLTADELHIAQQCGQTPEQYQEQKEKMLRMKAAGAIQDGR
jgi:hypothetical protein